MMASPSIGACAVSFFGLKCNPAPGIRFGTGEPWTGGCMTAYRRDVLLFVTFAAAVATPALGQTVTPAANPAGATQVATSVPDVSGVWRHMSLPGFEPLPSGPRPVTNRSR